MNAKQLIGEIHRRSIWQLLAISIGGSFSVVGNAELLTGTFGFPAWLLPGSLILLAVGVIAVFGVKLWPTVSNPSPAATHSAIVALWYIAIAYFGLEVLDAFVSTETIPDRTFDVALAAYILFLPVAMVVAYLRYTGRNPAAKHAAIVGLIYMGAGFVGSTILLSPIVYFQIIPPLTLALAVAAYFLLVPVVVLVSYLRYKPPGTSDEWVYERLRPGLAGDWVFDQLLDQGLTVDAALAKIRAAADQIEQDMGKRPSGPSAKRVQRRRDAEQKADAE